MRRTGIDTRRPVQTSNNSNWLHAVGFVVLAAIVHEGLLRQDIPRPRAETTALDARRRDGRPDRALRERGVGRAARAAAVLRRSQINNTLLDLFVSGVASMASRPTLSMRRFHARAAAAAS